MEKIFTYISTSISCLFIIINILIFILGKVSKNKKLVNKLTKYREYVEAIRNYVKTAETFINFTGEQKRDFVLNKMFQWCSTNCVAYDEESVSSELEDLIIFSKTVNKGE